MVEAALMVAFASVLSLFKLVEMPYGGSVTFASMFPIAVVAYRHGTGTGLAAGLVYAVIQQLLGLNTLSYFTAWYSIIAVMLLDYLLAFTVVGFGGIFRGAFSRTGMLSKAGSQKAELGTGMALVCIFRYILHTVGGATVWAGLSIPTEAALIYSIGYNATYMLPETIISVLVAVWIGGVIDFSRDVPTRFAPSAEKSTSPFAAALPSLSAFTLSVAVITAVVLIAPHLQDADDGHFTFALLGEVNWIAVAIVLAVGVLLSLATYISYVIIKKRTSISGV